jgi:RNA polymerase sigma-70 factor (ECF subfamily)
MTLTPGTSPEDLAMARYSRGDDVAFSDLYDALAPRLFGFLRRHAGAPSAVDDFLQQTFMQLHRARGTFACGAAVLPWAFAIARRLCMDAARHRRRHASESAVTLDDVAPPEAPADASPEAALAAAEAAE